MMEALVSFIVAKLGDFAARRAERIRYICDDIEWLKKELLMMQAVIRGAEKRGQRDPAFAEWLEQVRNIAFMIEDFLDSYTYREYLPDHRRDLFALSFGSSLSSEIINHILATARMTTESIYPSKTADEIATIKKEVEWISRRAQTYGLNGTRDEGESSTTTTSRRATRQSSGCSPLFEAAEMVGFDEDVKKLMDWLLSEDDNIPWSFMFVVGMGGSGKTALARRVYKRAHNHFDHHLWVTGSQYSHPLEVQNEVAEFFERIHSSSRKRYVLVLDDISDSTYFRDIIRWLDGHGGEGRIIVTSRQNITASLLVHNYQVHQLKPLPDELARDLFFKRAFRHHAVRRTCPDYMNDVAKEIVRKCSGLPLAIVLMGDLMFTKEASPREWKDVLDHFSQQLLHNPQLEGINCIFQASYNELPSHLQYCFLYSCLFPKGSEIKRKRIIRLWVAQGFVKEEQGKTLEEVASDYFMQLIERSMLEPIISDFTGEISSYRVHDIVYDLAKGEFKQEFGIFHEAELTRIVQTRYLAIHSIDVITSAGKENLKARALLAFGWCTDQLTQSLEHSLEALLPNLLFLKVLCLDGIKISHLPGQVGDLFHLTYLGLRKTRIQYLPSSLGRLQNLQTLDVRDTEVKTLPDKFPFIRSLRHLLLSKLKIHGVRAFVQMPYGRWPCLQTLSGVKACTYLTRILGRFTQLKKLYVGLSGEENVSRLFASINRIENLYSLKIECHDRSGKYTSLALETTFPLPEYLEKLTLGGVIMELPPWFKRFNSLRVLQLVNSMLVSDPLRNLSWLPNLVSLTLFHAYTGEQMGCGQGGYPKLRHLHITSFIELEEWTPIEEGTMPCIQILSVVDCSKLRMLPQGFEQLKTLESLELIQMPREFIRRLEEEDLYKVEHIPKRTTLPRDIGPSTSNSRASSSPEKKRMRRD